MATTLTYNDTTYTITCEDGGGIVVSHSANYEVVAIPAGDKSIVNKMGDKSVQLSFRGIRMSAAMITSFAAWVAGDFIIAVITELASPYNSFNAKLTELQFNYDAGKMAYNGTIQLIEV